MTTHFNALFDDAVQFTGQVPPIFYHILKQHSLKPEHIKSCALTIRGPNRFRVDMDVSSSSKEEVNQHFKPNVLNGLLMTTIEVLFSIDLIKDPNKPIDVNITSLEVSETNFFHAHAPNDYGIKSLKHALDLFQSNDLTVNLEKYSIYLDKHFRSKKSIELIKQTIRDMFIAPDYTS